MFNDLKKRISFLYGFVNAKALLLLITVFILFHTQYFVSDFSFINYFGFFVSYLIFISFQLYVLSNLNKSYNFLKEYIDLSTYKNEFNTLYLEKPNENHSFSDSIYNPEKICFDVQGKLSFIECNLFNKSFKLSYNNFKLKKSNNEYVKFIIENELIPFEDPASNFKILDLNFNK